MLLWNEDKRPTLVLEMYKVVFFKFFLFILYCSAGLFTKFSSFFDSHNSVDDTEELVLINRNPGIFNVNNNIHNQFNAGGGSHDRPRLPNQSGIATNWVNPFMTRYRTSTTTTTTTTTSTTGRRTARPRTRINKKIAR